jgi:hypothetical protein
MASAYFVNGSLPAMHWHVRSVGELTVKVSSVPFAFLTDARTRPLLRFRSLPTAVGGHYLSGSSRAKVETDVFLPWGVENRQTLSTWAHAVCLGSLGARPDCSRCRPQANPRGYPRGSRAEETPYFLRKSFNQREWAGWRRRLSACASICLTRSRVTPSFFPTSSSV